MYDKMPSESWVFLFLRLLARGVPTSSRQYEWWRAIQLNGTNRTQLTREEGYMAQAKTNAKKQEENAPAAQSTTGALEATQSINADHHRRMIAEKAYFKAQQRLFAPGMEIQDWLEAEQELELKAAKR
jgi:hypothetical protein